MTSTGTRELLDDSAVDTPDLTCGGTADDNNVFGEGRLDVLAAANAAPIGDTGAVERRGRPTSTSGDPIAGARVAFTGASDRETTTDADGEFHMTLVAGSYDVEVEAFGYETATSDFELEDGEEVALGLRARRRRTRTS